MPAGWKTMSAAEQWEAADPFPSAGRDSGPFLAKVRDAARSAALWVVCGLVVRSQGETAKDEPNLLRAVALIGADGWLHALHTDMRPVDGSCYKAGTGEWPATKDPRPRGVYDTDIGRIAVCASPPNKAALANLASMGAELIVTPPEADAPAARTTVDLHLGDTEPDHCNYTRYALCGPEALPSEPAEDAVRHPTVIQAGADGKLQAEVVAIPFAEMKRAEGEGA
jgi:predicted amidohydrolase